MVEAERFISPDVNPDIVSLGLDMFSLSLDSRRPFKVRKDNKKDKKSYLIEPLGDWVEHKERDEFILYVPNELFKDEEDEFEYEFYKADEIFTHKNKWITSAPRQEM